MNKKSETNLTREDFQDLLGVYHDFEKCYDIVNKLAQMFPNESKSWVGTVSERLEFLTTKIIVMISFGEKI